MDKLLIFRRTVSLVGRHIYRWSDFAYQRGDIAEFHIIDGCFHGAAILVPHDQDQLGTSHFTAEFHASQKVFIYKISSYPPYEDIANTSIENVLNRYAAIQTR